jgi:3-hydroxy-3-methylglutaryl CoA synthase
MTKERLSKLQKTILLTLLEKIEERNQKYPSHDGLLQSIVYHTIFSYSAKNYGASKGSVCASDNAYEYHVYDMPFCSSFSRSIRLLERKKLIRLDCGLNFTKISDIAFTVDGLKLSLLLKATFNNKRVD